jgi:hypothetical protein
MRAAGIACSGGKERSVSAEKWRVAATYGGKALPEPSASTPAAKRRLGWRDKQPPSWTSKALQEPGRLIPLEELGPLHITGNSRSEEQIEGAVRRLGYYRVFQS